MLKNFLKWIKSFKINKKEELKSTQSDKIYPLF